MKREKPTVKRMLLSLVAASLMSTSLFMGPASAHDQTRWDANDTGGFLDLKWVTTYEGHGEDHWSEATRVWFCVQTRAKWYPYMLKGSKGIWFYLDVRDDRASEYEVRFIGHNGNLRGALFSYSRQKVVDRFPGYRFAHKHGGCVYVKRRYLKPIQQHLMRWSVATYYHSRRICYRYGCYDWTRTFSHFNV